MGSPAPKTPLMVLDAELFIRETQSLNDCNHIAYTCSVMHQWIHGSMPADLDECARIMRLHDADRLATAHALLRRFFRQRTDGTWAHLGTQERRSASRAKSSSYSERGMKGNAKRWAGHIAKRPSKNPAYVGRYATAYATPVVKASSTSTPSLPSQAQGISPSPAPPLRLVAESTTRRSASHGATLRKAAKRSGGRRPPAVGQTAIPLAKASREPWQPLQASANESEKKPSHSAFTPHDPRFEELANELRNSFYPELNGGAACPWGSRQKRAAAMFLQACTHPMEQIRAMLMHRADSIRAGVVQASEDPAAWLEKLPTWLAGPANNFGDPVRMHRRSL